MENNINLCVVSEKRLLLDKKNYSLYYYRGDIFCLLKNESKQLWRISIPISRWQRILTKAYLAERMLRLEAKVAIPIDSEKDLFSYHGSIYCIDVYKRTITKEHCYRSGMNNPISFCKVENLSNFPDCILYGEYWGNPNKEECCIYARIQGAWKKVVSFPIGTVAHIHGIVVDKYRNQLIILTGDNNNESGIWAVKGGFSKPIPIVHGGQKYRACVLFPLESSMVYATDSPLEQNYIFELEFKENKVVQKILFKLPGPCIHGRIWKRKKRDSYVLATSVEPDSRIKGIRYLFSYKKGFGVSDFYTHLIVGNAIDGFVEITKLKKDCWPMTLFQFGNVTFPYSEDSSVLYLCPQSIIKYDGKTMKANCY